MKARFILERQGSLYKFVSIWQGNDFSLYVAFDVPRRPNAVDAFRLVNQDDAAEKMETARRLAYHTTGRVNYHGLLPIKPRYFEPLSDVTRRNTVFAIEVSDFARLEPLEPRELTDTDRVMRCNDVDAVCFALSIIPTTEALEEGAPFFRMDFERFSAALHAIAPPVHVGQSGVHAFAPQSSGHQTLSKEEAELAYVQGGARELIVSGPNGQGTYTLYPAVIMRTTPRVTMEFTRPDLRLEVDYERSRAHKVFFRLVDKHGLVRQADLRGLIAGIELDAEL